MGTIGVNVFEKSAHIRIICWDIFAGNFEVIGWVWLGITSSLGAAGWVIIKAHTRGWHLEFNVDGDWRPVGTAWWAVGLGLRKLVKGSDDVFCSEKGEIINNVSSWSSVDWIEGIVVLKNGESSWVSRGRVFDKALFATDVLVDHELGTTEVVWVVDWSFSSPALVDALKSVK